MARCAVPLRVGCNAIASSHVQSVRTKQCLRVLEFVPEHCTRWGVCEHCSHVLCQLRWHHERARTSTHTQIFTRPLARARTRARMRTRARKRAMTFESS